MSAGSSVPSEQYRGKDFILPGRAVNPAEPKRTEWALVRLLDRLIMQPADRTLNHETIWRLTILAVLALQCTLIVTHRPWLDEWQSLLISLQTTDIHQLVSQLKYEGHPPLWYLYLRGIGFVSPHAAWVMPIANLILALVIAWAIICRSPFSRVERLALLLSEFLLIEYLTIARSLGMGAAFVFLALVLWKRRSTWIPIALLPACDFIFGLISIFLIVARWESRRDLKDALWKPGILLWFVTSLISAMTVIPAADVVTEELRGFVVDTLWFLVELGTILVPWQGDNLGWPIWTGSPPLMSGLVLAPIFFRLVYQVARKSQTLLISIFGFILILYIFKCTVYPLYYRHTSIIALALIVILWLRGVDGEPMVKEARVWLASTAFFGLATAIVLLIMPFDTAYLAAKRIRNLNLQHETWISVPDFRAVALNGELDSTAGNILKSCTFSFHTWNTDRNIETDQLLRLTQANIRRLGRHYMVTPYPLPPEFVAITRSLGSVPPGYDGQPYYLWEVGGHVPKTGVQLPPCIPSLRPTEQASLWTR